MFLTFRGLHKSLMTVVLVFGLISGQHAFAAAKDNKPHTQSQGKYTHKHHNASRHSSIHHHAIFPIGYSVHYLPYGYHSYRVGAHVYYRFNHNTYRWRPEKSDYVVVQEPEGISDEKSNDDDILPAPLIFYPAKNQTDDEQEKDRFTCHKWAKEQTGYDPLTTVTANTQNIAAHKNYQRAISACMEAKNYVVK